MGGCSQDHRLLRAHRTFQHAVSASAPSSARWWPPTSGGWGAAAAVAPLHQRAGRYGWEANMDE